jgi:hypothetical protein
MIAIILLAVGGGIIVTAVAGPILTYKDRWWHCNWTRFAKR